MKTTALKTIYLSEDELKKAIADFIAKEHKELGAHVRANKCSMGWHHDNSSFVVQIQSEVQDKVLTSTPSMSRLLRVAENAMARHGATLDRILDLVEGKSRDKYRG